jgi:hypothetical protein
MTNQSWILRLFELFSLESDMQPRATGGISYRLDVDDGVVRSTRPGGSLYQ